MPPFIVSTSTQTKTRPTLFEQGGLWVYLGFIEQKTAGSIEPPAALISPARWGPSLIS